MLVNVTVAGLFHPMEYFVPCHGTLHSTLWNTSFHPMEHLIPFIPIPDPRHWNMLFQALE